MVCFVSCCDILFFVFCFLLYVGTRCKMARLSCFDFFLAQTVLPCSRRPSASLSFDLSKHATLPYRLITPSTHTTQHGAAAARFDEEEGAEAGRPQQDQLHQRAQEPVHHPEGVSARPPRKGDKSVERKPLFPSFV